MKPLFTFVFLAIFCSVVAQKYEETNQRLFAPKSEKLKRFTSVPSESIGPSIMSGRITDIEVNPENPHEMFVAYASGGLWYTANNGQSLRPIFDSEASITIGDIAVNWISFTIYVGTGENNSSRSSYAGTGIYQSSDTGKTWTYLGLEESHHIGKILIHPQKPNILYVGVLGHLYSQNEERGVYKSIDSGKTWNKVLFVNSSSGCIDLCFDPLNPEHLYAATWDRLRTPWNFRGNGPGSGIFQSLNGGTDWKKIYDSPNIGRIGLAPYIENNKSGLYAIMDDQNPLKTIIKDTSQLDIDDILTYKSKPLKAFLNLNDKKLNNFLRSNNFPKGLDADSLKQLLKDKKFTIDDVINYTGDANSRLFKTNYIGAKLIKTDLTADIKWELVNDSIHDFYYSYGYYFGQISVLPQNPQEIYILGVVLAYSDNGGKTFYKLNDENVHGDHHVLWINPKDQKHIINGNDGGLNISYDRGKHWVKCNSPAVGQFYSVAVDEKEKYNVYGGLQDNGVWKAPRHHNSGNYWHSTGKYPYEFIMGGDGMQVAIDLQNDLVYTGFQFGNYYRLDLQKKSRDYITPKHSLGEMPYRFNWQTPIMVSKHSQNTLYFGGNYLFRSFDQGENWKKISGDLTLGGKTGNVPYGTLTTIDESALKFGLLYTGSDDGLIYNSRDVGNNWKNISIDKTQGLWVSRVRASMHTEARVYVALNGYRNDDFKPYLYRSDDYGNKWESISGNLPAEPINVIIEDIYHENILYIGSDNGLYVSMNNGKTWEKLSNLPRVAVHDLVIQKNANELVVATHGRSLYIVPLDEINGMGKTIPNQEVILYPFKPLKVSQNWGKSNYFWEKEWEPSSNIAFYLPKAMGVEINILDSVGNLLFVQKIDAKMGVNYFQYAYISDRKDSNSKQMRKGANGKYYLKPGKYTLKLKADGKDYSQKLTLAESKNQAE